MLSLQNITTNFIFFAGGVSILISISELFVRHRRIENYIFCALLFCFGMLMFQIGFIADGAVKIYPRIFYFHTTFLYLVGPIGYFAYFLIILPWDTLPARTMFYLLPAVMAIAFDIQFMLMPVELQKTFLEGLLYNGNMSEHVYARIVFACAGIQILVYLGGLFIRFLLIWIKEGHANVLLVSMGYLLYTIIASEMEISGYWFVSTRNIEIGAFMMAFLFICAFLVSQRFPKFLQLIIDETEKKNKSKSTLGSLDVDSLIPRLKECMEEKKMYLNDELTLKDLAVELGITSHQLSELMNERIAMNFNNFVNQYRINESKMLLMNEPDRSVLSIAYAVGFNTKSSFYYAFSRFTGKTPQDFRRENS